MNQRQRPTPPLLRDVKGWSMPTNENVSWQDVWPGQDWRFPDGDTWHVGAIRSDGCERFAMCTQDGDVMLLPAETLAAQATLVKRK
jgi:hypothetical protein